MDGKDAAAIDEARSLLGVPAGQGLTPSDLRRLFLRRAVRIHPDKNPSPDAGDRFARLKDAHDLLLRHCVTDAHLAAEQSRSAALLEVLLRAFTASISEPELESRLRSLGVHRPPADFGVAPDVRFDSRVPQCRAQEDVDAEANLRAVFQEAGVPWEEAPRVPGLDEDEELTSGDEEGAAR